MKNCLKVLVFGVTAVLVFTTVAFSQTSHVPVIQDNSPAVLAQNPPPHTPSGKPDLSGVWAVPSTDEAKILVSRYGPQKTERPEMTPWGQERWEYNQDPRSFPGYDPNNYLTSEGGGTLGTRTELNPFYKCVPPGTAYLITGWGSWAAQEIIQTDKRVLMIYEYGPTIRQIWTDGRKNPDSGDLSWVGNSIGTWDGDTLVVDTVGLRNEPWLDGGGHVASTGLHIIERYRRIDNDTLQIDFTYDDPKAFKKPWTRREFRRLRPTWALQDDTRCYPGSPEVQAQQNLFDEIYTQP